MYFWVNQGKTYKEEKEGGYLWAPVVNSSGQSFFHWKNMEKLQPGDIVFNYRKGTLVGYCIVQSNAFLAPQPEEFTVDVEWEKEGYMADAKYYLFNKQLNIEDIYSEVNDLLPSKYSPLNVVERDGKQKIKGNQGYLYELNTETGQTLLELFNVNTHIALDFDGMKGDDNTPDVTSRRGLVLSRVGQGEYRRRILKRWGYKCAVNRSGIKEILIASHIVPWRDATNKERLDVENGILLSPVYDALFDTHLISFDNNGCIILSKSLSREEFLTVGVNGSERIDNLTDENKKYLERHRQKMITI